MPNKIQIKLNDLERFIFDKRSFEDKRYRILLNKRYGLTDGITHTLVETGRFVGISAERTRQLIATAECRMLYSMYPNLEVKDWPKILFIKPNYAPRS